MTEAEDKIVAMVEKAIKHRPDISTQELQERAEKIDPGAGELTRRQFHAKYPLRVKRRLRGRSTDSPRKRTAVKASTFAEAQLNRVLEDLTATIREDFQATLKKDSLQEADAFLTRLARLDQVWKGSV